jgi:hypothetical protein
VKRITVSRSLEEFRALFDAGGHWWNLRTKAGDGTVTVGEVSVAAGHLVADFEAMAALELHLAALPYGDRRVAEGMLDETVTARRKRAGFRVLRPHDVESVAAAGENVVVAGSTEELKGISDPGGTAPVWEAMPESISPGITHLWVACQMHQVGGGAALIAWPRTEPALPAGMWAFAGTVREIIPAASRRREWTKFVFAVACSRSQ